MSSKIIAFSAVVALAASSALAQDLQINTPPQLVECQPASLAWTGANAPFFLSVIPGGQPSGTPLKQFGQQDASPVTWTVDVPQGTSVTLSLTDSTGATAFSDAVTIVKGTDDKCIGKGAAAGGSSSNSTSSAAAPADASGSSSAASSHGSGHASSSSSAAGTRTTGAASADSAESSGAAPAGGNAAAASGSATPDDDSAAGSLVARSTVAVVALVGAFAVLA